jgi:hypothetical protein
MPPVKGKKRGLNQEWEGNVAAARSTVIDDYAKQVIRNKQGNGGKIKYGFVAGLCKSALGSLYEITADCINNKVKRIKEQELVQRYAAVSLANLALNSNNASVAISLKPVDCAIDSVTK